MRTAVTDVAAVARACQGKRDRSADRLFDDEQHAHERHDGQRCRSHADDDDGGHQPEGRKDAAEPGKAKPSHVFTVACGVRIHDGDAFECSDAPDSIRWDSVSEAVEDE